MKRIFTASLILLLFLTGQFASADHGSQNQIQVNENRFFDDLLSGQKQIWTSPFRIQSRDLIWIAPLIGSTALSLTKDSDWSHSLQPSVSTLDTSGKISYLGSAPVVFSSAAALYFLGKLTHNNRAKVAGFLSLEALTDATILVQGTKLITGRERPRSGDLDGSFWVQGNSFPSGHSASVWALAAVFSGVYPDQKLLQIGAFSLATVVSVSRVTSKNHYVSDVIVGSAVGYLVGRMVVKRHTVSSSESKLQSISPYIDQKNGEYGLNAFIQW
jgi:membrane-associated phospholipid phosphatase